jgi:hypothetical protein
MTAISCTSRQAKNIVEQTENIESEATNRVEQNENIASEEKNAMARNALSELLLPSKIHLHSVHCLQHFVDMTGTL